jgi:tetratricopeptide (TPR) repeat protein
LTRISVLAASVKVASEYEVFLNRLGNSNRGRRTEGGERADYPEETIRTFYYKFCGTHPQMDQEFDLAWSLYIEWKEWAIAADEQTIKMALQLYRESGRPPEDTEQFATLVKELRSEVTQAEWDEENKRRLEVYRSRSQSDPRSANAVTTVAYFLHKARKFAEAITNYENARELTKADPELPVWRKDEIRRWIDDQIQRCEKGTAPVRHEVPYVPPSLQVIGPTSARPQPRDAAKPGKRH